MVADRERLPDPEQLDQAGKRKKRSKQRPDVSLRTRKPGWPRVCQADVMEKADAVALLDVLHDAQNRFYGGEDTGPLAELLTADIVWTVPGNNRIAGCYQGLDEVFGYFRHRRELASRTFRMHRKDILVGDGDQVAALTNGIATIAGRERRWSAVGLYTVTTDQRIAACWLLPLDSYEFDAIWS